LATKHLEFHHRCGMYVLHVFLPIFHFFNTIGKKKSGTFSLFSEFFWEASSLPCILINDAAVVVDSNLISELSGYGIADFSGLVPADIFSWASLATPRGFILMVIGGFLVGFGTRYAGGCTSGHAIMGLSNLQLPSLIATISFMAGGFIMANLILPFILSL